MSLHEMLVTITDNASAKLREIAARENRQAFSLRMAAVQTHCMGGKGFTYKLVFDDSATRADDDVSEHNGIKVCVDEMSAKYLKGAEIDYVETLAEAGFKINNPNVISKCPCGHHDIFE